ncbi:MAG: protein kinase [Kofleriaceae bacterium]|nr:protein kinase [Kofleriaceae bacterium]
MTRGYRVLSRIGSGTMGQVYEAEDTSTGKHVALKVLRKSHNKDLAARFLREGKTLALLSHPNIVQLVDMGQLDDGTLFLATELVPGGSLREVMDRGRLEHGRALELVRQLLAALQAAHELGVVHRDIKPENVMVGDGDFVKVLDFGVAKLLADTVAGLGEANLTSVGFSIFGSALYIAPESVIGQPVDARIDIYSTGAMLFEMLAGSPPFDDENPAVLLHKQAFEPAPTLAQAAPSQTFAPELEALVARALAKQPDDRFRSAADMSEAVEVAMRTFAPARPVPAPSAPAEVVPARPSVQDRAATELVRRPKPRRLVLGGIAAALVAVVAIAMAARGGSGATARTRPDVTSPEQAATYLSKGHSELELGHYQQALAAYERALRAAPQLGNDKTLRANLLKVADGKDSLAIVLALDLLTALSPPAHDAVVAYASSGKLMDPRHRAMMIAERDGVADKVDRVQSAILDLQQTSSCDERKALIAQLGASKDRRALPALKRIRSVKCVEREATDAIGRLEAAN